MSDSENKLLQQDEIEALIKPSDSNKNEQYGSQGLSQAEIDAMLGAARDDAGQELDQAEIDAMLGAARDDAGQELDQAEIDAMLGAARDDAGQGLSQDEIDTLFGTGGGNGREKYEIDEPEDEDLQSALTPEEKDALGEIGNISMGSSATTLSQLLNKRVQITSPKVIITRQRDFFEGFNVPYLVIRVRFKEGLSGYNVLVIKMRDAMVMANLMMGRDGTDLQDEISELEISAAAEAMNQMIGSASTALADMLDRSINILPPETDTVMETSKFSINLPFEDPIVVSYFRMTINGLLDTNIMQVLDINTAREQTRLLLEKFGVMDVEAEEEVATPVPEPGVMEKPDNAQVQDRTAQQRDDFTTLAGREKVATQSTNSGYDKDALPQVDPEKLNMLMDIPLKVSVVLGRTQRQIKEVLHMTPGAIVELETLVDEPVDILINGKLVAKGEVVVVNENFGVKITSIISTRDRINSLR
ncbi:flagellar motor switch phosphatase FliY [Desulfallas thermosapovorans]|uniref:Flagellar motor switch protein FliN/FliY n=1 Tax=Desulfallas thermosapovorans DSM 6562 TaxID=1121431 RepID=A0A5S4ZTU0_9FIRM|nr:flagellar motor switch phosphatase FliY [Desulfallas thermosapovorans]TYO96283.1 flagellar motor switch protein FliN/FliY [Desulfallas thermosapovorans DSM 6562]